MPKTMTALAIGFVFSAGPAFAQNPPDPPAPKPSLGAQLFLNSRRRPFRRAPGLPSSTSSSSRRNQPLAKPHRSESTNLGASDLLSSEAKGQALKALQDKQSSSTGILTRAAGEKLQQETDRAALEIQYAKLSADRELSTLNDDLVNKFSLKVQPVVESIRAERQLWAVFLMNENLAAMMPGLDVSSEVVRRLDAKK